MLILCLVRVCFLNFLMFCSGVLVESECYFILSSVVVIYFKVLKFWLKLWDWMIFLSSLFGIGLFVLWCFV